ncbi:MAG TPA: hypothetical protein VGG36_11785 [Rhizomicrobium sp.]
MAGATVAGAASASREKADAFLDEQIALSRKQSAIADLQIEDLKREDKLRHWSLIVHHFSDVMKLAFEFAVAAIVLGILALLTGAVWSAAHEKGLVIEAFSVPPDMANRGLTGQAVAAQLQDKLTAMQTATVSARPAASYSNNWGNDIKVEIPNTGVSIGEFYRYLVQAFGHQTHITGEVFRAANGISITARASGDGGATVSGAETNLDALLQLAAENIYARTQPYRYAVYLENVRHDVAKARALYEKLIATGDAREQAWAHIGLGVADIVSGDSHGARDEHALAAATEPGFALAYLDLDFDESALGHDEAALATERMAIRLMQNGSEIDMSDQAKPSSLLLEQANEAFSVSDFNAALAHARKSLTIPDYNDSQENARETIIGSYALLHDGDAWRANLRSLPPTSSPFYQATRASTEAVVDYWSQDWPGVLAMNAVYEADMGKSGGSPSGLLDLFSRQSWPYDATALAMMGKPSAANALIDKTPLDCYTCLRNRADIDAVQKNWAGADYWFARATKAAPSIPMAFWDWGRVLLERGDANGAIAKFTLANQKGPHFADPLEGWGEALMAQNRSDLALAKFADADKDAPNWGRLHLKWGEALFWSGDKTGAAKQFAIARALDLAPPEKSELAKVSHG